MTTSPQWRKIDGFDTPYHLDHDDNCLHAREYTSRGGYSASETNNLISNFKKHPRYKGEYAWRYKLQAIDRFARELACILLEDKSYCLIPVPTSKSECDAEYDDRLDATLDTLKKKYRPNVSLEKPISFKDSHESQHHRGEDRMKPHDVFAQLEWRGFSDSFSNSGAVIFVDDVITTGAHFKACKKLVLAHFPGLTVQGIFWAKTVWNA